MLRCKECGKRFVVDRGQLTFYSYQDQSKWNERNVFNMYHKLLVILRTEERPIHSR